MILGRKKPTRLIPSGSSLKLIIKTICIGAENAGKTSAITRYRTGEFNDNKTTSSRKPNSYGFIGGSKKGSKTPTTEKKKPRGPVLSETEETLGISLRSLTEYSSRNEIRRQSSPGKYTGNPDKISDKIEAPEPFAFGFMDLLEEEEKKKLEDLNAKVTNKKPKVNLTIERNGKDPVPWTTKVCTSFASAPKVNRVTGIMFFFSLASVESFEYVKKLLEEYYSGSAQDYHHALILVGTHNDCEHEVTKKDIECLVEQYSITYYPCSSLSNYNITEVFHAFENQLIWNAIQYPRWLRIRTSLKDKLGAAVVARNTARVKHLVTSQQKRPSELLKSGWSAMHIAVWEAFFEAVFIFVQIDPNCVNATNPGNWTPLHIASRMGLYTIAEFLLDSGADPLALDSDNLTPSDAKNAKIRLLITQAQKARNRNSTLTSLKGISSIIRSVQNQGITNLDLSHASLPSIPEEILECTQLKQLNLANNKIKDMAKNYQNLTNLEKYNLLGNEITSIPDAIGGLKYLKFLDLRHNKIASISPVIANITTLKRLLLAHNVLTHLPSQITKMETTLEVFNIYGNPLSTLPPDVIPRLGDSHPQNMAPLFSYLRNINIGGKEEHNRVKVMFVGNGNVGKTSLLNCFIEKDKKKSMKQTNVKAPEPTDTIATDGIDINTVTMPLPRNKEMIWDCWDYAGQEIYYSTHQFFLSPRSVYLVCFSLLDRDLSKVEYWINSVHTRACGSPIFLVGTHVDDKECTDEYVDAFIQRLLTTLRPERFRNTLGIQSIRGIHALSCKKRTGIKELINDISDVVQKERFVGQLFPSSWLKLEHTLGTLRSNDTPILDWDDFARIASGCQIESALVKEVAKFLHMTGVICYFDDKRSGLSELVVLDPQFLTNVMSAVVTLKHRYRAGIIYHKDLDHIWREFPQSIHGTLMNLLERFEIAHTLPDPDTAQKKYIIPCLLRPEMPDISKYWSFSGRNLEGLIFSRIYRFVFLPLGFFSRLFVRNLHLPNVTSLAHWSNGQLLETNGIVALLRYNPTTYNLHLQVHAAQADKNARQFNQAIRTLRVLIENIETTIEGWYECTVNVTIPCSHCLMEGSYSQWEFSLEDCMERIANNDMYILCRDVRRIRLDILAPDLSLSDMKKLQIDFNSIEMGEEIGEGAFGIVCKGILNGELVAVKQLVIFEEESSNSSPGTSVTGSFGFSEQSYTFSEEREEFISKFAEFQREVWLMSSLHHRNVCSLRGICISPMAMIMEYLELGDLFHVIGKASKGLLSDSATYNPNSPLNLQNFSVKVKIAYDIASGMNHLHSFDPPIVHRDVRTPNIFIRTLDINTPACALVGDLGLSRVFASSLAGGAFNRNWLAPEVMKGETYSGKMDVYSFAIVMWELVTLKRPFSEYDDLFDGKPASFFKKSVIEGLRPTVPDSCDEKLKNLIHQCWDPNPDNRLTFSEILEVLKELMISLNIPLFEDSLEEQSDDLDIGTPMSLVPASSITVAALQNRLTQTENFTVQSMILVGLSAWCAAGGSVYLYNAQTTDFLKEIKISDDEIYSMINMFNERVWIADEGGRIFHYSPDGKKLAAFREHSSAIRAMTLVDVASEGGTVRKRTTIWTADVDGNLNIWAARDSKEKVKVKQRIKLNHCVGCMMQVGNHVVIGTEGPLLLLNASTGNVEQQWNGHQSLVNAIVTHERTIWSCSNDGSIIVWEISGGEQSSHELQAHSSRVYCLLSHAGFIWAGSFDKTISVWNPQTLSLIQELKFHGDGINSLLSTPFQTVWSGSLGGDGSIGVWECKDITDPRNVN